MLLLCLATARAVSLLGTAGQASFFAPNRPARIRPFVLAQRRKLVQVTVTCPKENGFSLTQAGHKNICGLSFSGSSEQVNRWAESLTAFTIRAGITAVVRFDVADLLTKRVFRVDQRLESAELLPVDLVKVSTAFVFTQPNQKVNIGSVEKSLVDKDSKLGVRPVGAWPKGLHVFLKQTELFLFFTEAQPVQEAKVAFRLFDHSTGLSSKPITLTLFVDEKLFNPKFSLTVFLAIFSLFLVLLAIVLFAVIPTEVSVAQDQSVNVVKSAEEVCPETVLSKSIIEWNKRVVSRIKPANASLSSTRDSMNRLEIRDVTVARVSPLDLSQTSILSDKFENLSGIMRKMDSEDPKELEL